LQIPDQGCNYPDDHTEPQLQWPVINILLTTTNVPGVRVHQRDYQNTRIRSMNLRNLFFFFFFFSFQNRTEYMKNIGVNSIAELNRYKECLQHYIYAQNSGLRDGKKIAD
jgi:hypothetical protein